MKASELRIGNLVYRRFWNPEPNNERHSFEFAEVCSISKEGAVNVSVGRVRLKLKLEDVTPIPLTEELYLSLGFSKGSSGWFRITYFSEEDADDVNVISVNVFSNRCTVDVESEETRSAYTAKGIQYVHQLQNLFFALAGEELKYSK